MNPRFSDSSVYSDESTRDGRKGLTTTEPSIPTDPQPADDSDRGRKLQEPASRDPTVDKLKRDSSGSLHRDYMEGKKTDLPHSHNKTGAGELIPGLLGVGKQSPPHALDQGGLVGEVFVPSRELEISENISLASKPKPGPNSMNPPFRLHGKQADLSSKDSGAAVSKEEKEADQQSHKSPAPDSENQQQTGGIVISPPSFHHSDLSQRPSTPSIRIETAPSLSPTTEEGSNVLEQAEPLGMARDHVSRPSSAPASTCDASLPPPSAMDLDEQITVLTEKLKDLQLRYVAVNKSIHEIVQREVPIHPTASAQVEMERQKLKALRDELGDIQKQELEFGLQLTKAWKTLDPVPQYGLLVFSRSKGNTS